MAKKILVVDDDAEDLNTIKSVLIKEGQMSKKPVLSEIIEPRFLKEI